MNAIQQREALENALNSFGLNNLTIYPKISVDKREKKPKFFLQQGAETISPVLDYNEMNHFILGMGTMQKLTNNKTS